MATEQARSYLQERIAFFCFALLACAVPFGVFSVVGLLIWPELRSQNQNPFLMMGGVALVDIAAVGVIARRGRAYSLRTLHTLDVVAVFPFAVVWGAGVYLLSDRSYNTYVIMMLCMLGVLFRALIVPSSAQRTFWVSTACVAPLFVGAGAIAFQFPERLGLPPAMIVTAPISLMAFAVALATIGSKVIYGLREEVREAKQLGQYTLGKKIGQGAMGSVFEASHAMLRRPTAIKLLPPDKAGDDSMRRFEQEVQLTSELTNPNTVAIFDYGRSPDGVFYYAMEYLEGSDLETLVTGTGAQPAGRVIHILRQVCNALDEAHERGLIHRDIKPANVILCRRGRLLDVAKVVDFGLVRDLQGDVLDSERDMIAGTPAYLSPEAIADPDRVGPASDLYAVGALGYFLLTGVTVFDGSVAEVCGHHVHTPPVPPSVRTKASIPIGLEELIMRCLHKEPGDRPADAATLGAGLAALREAEDWDDDKARNAWRALDTARVRSDRPAVSSAPTVAMTVDLAGRDATDTM